MYIQLVSIHGLIRGKNVEMGRDADTGGQVRYVLELARSLAAMEGVTQVDLFTRRLRDKRVSSDYSQEIEELAPNCRLVRLPCGGGKYMRKERLWCHLDDFVDAMISFTRHEGRTPTIVHGHYADAGYIARQVASTFGIPFVFTGHSLGRDKQAYLLDEGSSQEQIDKEFRITERIGHEEACLAVADLVVTSTRHERDVQYARYHNGNVPRFEVIPPGLDLERFFPYYEYDLNGSHITERHKQARMRMERELKRFLLDPEKPLILALCRPDKRKNIGALIQAYGKSPNLQAQANLAVFAGIRENVEEMGDDEREVFTDMLLMMDRYDLYGKMAVPKRHKSESDVPELYRLAAASGGVFVNAAFVEPFGLTFIESAACGCPWVGTQNGGPQDIVKNCDCGSLVNVEKTEEIANAIGELLMDRDLWDRKSNNGVNRVREFYAWEAHCKRYVDCIGELTEKPTKNVFTAGKSDVPLGKRLASLDRILITDIDNTLLGDQQSLKELRDLIHRHQDQMGFGVATGRHLNMAIDVLRENGIDMVDLLITSVGTEIYYGQELVPDRGWASHLRPRWKPDRVRSALETLDFLSMQVDEETQREYKISYDLAEGIDAQEALPLIHNALTKERLAYNLVFSHGAYVDILPHRASKGRAIRYLSGKWDIPIKRIATAGDSGNDHDMLVGDTAAIVVGNHDRELEDLRRPGRRVYFAEAHHAAGIIEGLKHWQFLSE